MQSFSTWQENYMSREKMILLCRGHTSLMNIPCKSAVHLLLGTDTFSDPGKNSWWWTWQPHTESSSRICSFTHHLESLLRDFIIYFPQTFSYWIHPITIKCTGLIVRFGFDKCTHCVSIISNKKWNISISKKVFRPLLSRSCPPFVFCHCFVCCHCRLDLFWTSLEQNHTDTLFSVWLLSHYFWGLSLLSY